MAFDFILIALYNVYMDNNETTQHKVRVFSTVVCPYCVTLKEFLKEKGIEFEDINVGEDEKARDEMIEKSGQMGVPVVDIDGEIVVGFDRGKIVEMLGIKD